MKTKLFTALLVAIPTLLFSQVSIEDYKRAEKMLPGNTWKLVFKDRVSPNWMDEGNAFWYKVNTKNETQFYTVDLKKKSKTLHLITKGY